MKIIEVHFCRTHCFFNENSNRSKNEITFQLILKCKFSPFVLNFSSPKCNLRSYYSFKENRNTFFGIFFYSLNFKASEPTPDCVDTF